MTIYKTLEMNLDNTRCIWNGELMFRSIFHFCTTSYETAQCTKMSRVLTWKVQNATKMCGIWNLNPSTPLNRNGRH